MFLDDLRKKSESEKKKYALLFAFVITVAIALVWYLSFTTLYGDKLGSEEAESVNQASIFDGLGQQIESIGDGF